MNIGNETQVLISIIGSPTSQVQTSSHYEVLLPVAFIIIFILVLFLIYAYNNLNLKQAIVEILCCLRGKRKRRQNQTSSRTQAHKSFAYQTNHSQQAANQRIGNFKMSTFAGTGPHTTLGSNNRHQNVYYTYRREQQQLMNEFEPQFYIKNPNSRDAHLNMGLEIPNNYDRVLFTTAPNYAYKLNTIYSSSNNTTSDYQLPSQQISKSNTPNSYNQQQPGQTNEYFSNSDSSDGSDPRSEPNILSQQFSSVVFNLSEINSNHNNKNYSHNNVNHESYRSSLSKKLSLAKSLQLKQRSSTIKTLNIENEIGSEIRINDTSNWNFSGSHSSVKPTKLSKLSHKLKDLSSESNILKSLCKELKSTGNSDSNRQSIYSLSNRIHKQFKYTRMCKSFTFASQSQDQKEKNKPLYHQIKKQQQQLNLEDEIFCSEPTQLNYSRRPNNKQDACVQTSTILSTTGEGESSANDNTMMQTNTFGSILANFGSASIRPSTTTKSEGLFEINRTSFRHRAFSDGNGLSFVGICSLPNELGNVVHHSKSSSKLVDHLKFQI